MVATSARSTTVDGIPRPARHRCSVGVKADFSPHCSTKMNRSLPFFPHLHNARSSSRTVCTYTDAVSYTPDSERTPVTMSRFVSTRATVDPCTSTTGIGTYAERLRPTVDLHPPQPHHHNRTGTRVGPDGISCLAVPPESHAHSRLTGAHSKPVYPDCTTFHRTATEMPAAACAGTVRRPESA